MTTDGPDQLPTAADQLPTAADLLFGSSADAPGALARHIMSAGRGLSRALDRLPRVTREAAVREAAAAAAGLLKADLAELLVAGWREHGDIHSAARRTLASPGSKELVGLAPHRVTTVQQPAVSILVDGRRVHTLQFGLSIFFEVTSLVAGISAGRLARVHSGRAEIGVALVVHEVEVLAKRVHTELPGVAALRSGFRLLPASAYPDDADHASHHPAAQFPGVDLLNGGSPAAEHGSGAGHSPGGEHSSGGEADHTSAAEAGHASVGEAEHSSVSWWEKSGPAR